MLNFATTPCAEAMTQLLMTMGIVDNSPNSQGFGGIGPRGSVSAKSPMRSSRARVRVVPERGGPPGRDRSASGLPTIRLLNLCLERVFRRFDPGHTSPVTPLINSMNSCGTHAPFAASSLGQCKRSIRMVPEGTEPHPAFAAADLEVRF